MKKNKILFFIFFLFLLSPIKTSAYLAPNIHISDLKINNITDYTISGEFNIINNEQYYLSDINYEIRLLQDTSSKNFSTIDIFVPKDNIIIQPGKSVIKTFTYKYPQNIISGTYILSIQAITATGIEMGWQNQNIELSGKDKFVSITNSLSNVLYNERKYTPLEGISIPKNDSITASLMVLNSGEEIAVSPRIKIFKRQVNMEIVAENQVSPIVIAKKETKNIKLELPKINIPGTYLAEVKFYNDNEQVSDTEYFRWVVEGDSGQILGVKLDKDFYKKGEEIMIIVDIIGPADATDIGSGKLMMSIYDSDNNLIIESSKDVLLKSSVVSSTFSITATNDLLHPNIKVNLTKGENILNKIEVDLPILSDEAKLLQKNNFIKKIFEVTLSIIVLVGVLIYIFYIINKRKIQKTI